MAEIPETVEVVKSLISHVGQKEPVYLQTTLAKPAAEKRKPVPLLIRLPHRLHKTSELAISLVVRDPQSAATKVLLDEDAPTYTTLKDVISVKKLKQKMRSKKEADKFKHETDLIVADERVIEVIPPVLGFDFYKSGKNMPVPIKLAPPPKTAAQRREAKTAIDAEFVKLQIKGITRCVRVAITSGTCLSAHIGYTNMPPEQIAANIEAVKAVLKEQFDFTKKKNVRAFHIKSPESAGLPVRL
ncbi:ribosome biogenesis protein Utp30p [Trichomonascus vanleenenianus]|uniref:ribosomal protein L1 family protein n=1 Tax=Trichomonascus vanleenenianus TaxID=2268995 RepID=UPI003EC9E5A8